MRKTFASIVALQTILSALRNVAMPKLNRNAVVSVATQAEDCSCDMCV